MVCSDYWHDRFWWLVLILKVLVALVLWRGMFLFLPLNRGRIAGRPEWPRMYGPLPVGTEVCEKGGELIRPNYTLGKFAVLEETINSLVLTLQVLVCSQLSPVLPLGGCLSMWVVAHCCCCHVLFPPVCSCFLHCTAVVPRELIVCCF